MKKLLIILILPVMVWAQLSEGLVSYYSLNGNSNDLAERTLVKVGETLFWLSETGVIRWDRRRLVPLSEHTIDIPLPTSDNDKYFAFYCPQRNQYILHREYEVYQLLLESGDDLLLESGEAILLE